MSTPKGLQVKLYDRDFEDLLLPLDVDFTINRYSKTINGGCKDAYITAYGNRDELWKLINMLRYALYIYDNKNEPVWWGYVAEVKVRIGNLVFGVSVDTMSNKIAVVYTSFGIRSTTPFSQDDFSVDEYGTKELLSVASDATNDEALQRRDSDLEAKKLPIPTIEFEAQSEGSFSANIIARGFYDTLGWKYYSQDKGLEEHSSNGVGQQNLGIRLTSGCLVFITDTNKITDWSEGLASFKKGSILNVTGTSSNNGVYTVAQGSTGGCSITVEENLSNETAASTTITSGCHIAQRFKQNSGSSWDASSIHVRIQPSGSPTDDIIARIWSHSSGCPSSELTSGVYAASDMSESMVWTEITLDSTTAVDNDTSYYAILSRSGSPSSASQYYKVDVDEGLGYEKGEFILNAYNWGWISRGVDADMLFKVVGTQSVVEQIVEAGDTAGQFLDNVISDIDTADVPQTNQYRDGETTALNEINELLKVGTNNSLRIIAEVTYARDLLIHEQVAGSTLDDTLIKKISSDGRLMDHNGQPISNYLCTVGVWAKLNDYMPATFDTTYVSTPNQFFIEECEYYVQSDKIVPRSIDTSNVWDLGKVKDG